MKFVSPQHSENKVYIQFHIQIYIDKILQQCGSRKIFSLSKELYIV